MGEAFARVCLEVQSDVENIALVRAALAGVGEAVGLEDELLADLRTAVSEACENVVHHAYGETSGPMLVGIRSWPGGATVSISDQGAGFVRSGSGGDGGGLGLSMIGALTRRAEVGSSARRGTEVRLWFGTQQARSESPENRDSGWRTAAPFEGDLLSYISPVSALRLVLGQVLRSRAATSLFTVGSVPELRAITDAVADYAECAAFGAVGFALAGAPRRLLLTAGPFRHGAGAWDRSAEAEAARRRRALYELVDEVAVTMVEGHEVLQVTMIQPLR